MNWILPDPDPAGLPAAVWLLQALLVFTFILHVFLMNIVVGGGAVSAVAGWRARRLGSGESAGRHRELAAAVARLLPASTAFAITTGVAPLLFLQVLYGQLFYSSSVLMAWFWLAVVPLLLAAYYGYYGLSFIFRSTGRDQGVPRLAPTLAAASTVLFVAIAIIFVSNMTLMLRPDRFAGMYAASDWGFHHNLDDGWAWPRLLHMLVGSLAVTGVFVGLLGRAKERRNLALGAWMASVGVRLFLVATLGQLLVGAWFLWSLPVMVRRIFLFGGPETMVLVTGIAFAIIAMLSASRSLVAAAIALAITITDMAIVRDMVRRLALAPYFSVNDLAVRPQTAVMIAFLVLLVAGLGVVGWMVARLAAGSAPGRSQEL